jgi:hypothetical protein
VPKHLYFSLPLYVASFDICEYGRQILIRNVKQAQVVYNFKNTKEKLLKTTAAIWFNKICKSHQLTPKYIKIEVNGNNKQSYNTKC